MKYLYKYPQAAFPYEQLVNGNKHRSRQEREFELLDTTAGVLKEYLKTLADKPEDLIHVDGDEEAIASNEDETHLFFGWKSKKKSID